MKWWFNFSCAL